MLVLFKKIRASLVGDGKVRKYIPYAIGDIDLVVNHILPRHIRAACNLEENYKNFNEISLTEMCNRMKEQPKLEALAVGMHHIHSRILRRCRRATESNIFSRKVSDRS